MEVLIDLRDPNGDPLDVESVTVSTAVNRGWTWSAVLGAVPHRYTVLEETDRSLLDAFPEDATYSLTLTVGG
jgi:hypothetical protein